jgi:type III secretion protein L
MWIVDKEKECSIVPGKRVLHADEFLALRGTLQLIEEGEKIAEKIIAQAQEKAKEIVAQATADAKALKDSSQAAFDEEKKKGFDAGAENGKKEMAAKLMEITVKNAKRYTDLEKVIVDIVMRAMRRIVGEMNDGDVVSRIVKNSLQTVRNNEKVIIRVHPDQAQTTRSGIAEIQAGSSSSLPIIEIVADGRLGMNSCLIETDVGVIDASLEVQMSAIRKVFEKTFASLQ